MTSMKAKPDFAVIGAMRAGTTQLYEMLRMVPGICVAEMKETDYFCSSQSVAKGDDWYARQFVEKDSLWGDISPNYAKTDVNPEAPDLLHSANPDMKLFFLARDPVSRAVSHYKMSYYLEKDLPDPQRLLSTWAGQHILHASLYHTCLVPFWDRFGDEVTIVDFDALISKPEQTVGHICRTLGLDQTVAPLEAEQAANSFEELSRRPDWWNELRESAVGERLRGSLPRPLVNMAKRHLALSTPKPPPPPFPEDVIEEMKERLAPDAERFRETTGLPFDQWSI
ncbi:MAG: sulfotransferase [Pseudomonadota bacterium]